MKQNKTKQNKTKQNKTTNGQTGQDNNEIYKMKIHRNVSPLQQESS
jgi:hypothetical protein